MLPPPAHIGCEGGLPSAARRGLTLVELLIAVSLLALTAGATMAALAGGLKVWRRATTLGTQRQAALITAEALRRDLLRLRAFTPLPFEGEMEEFSAPAVDRAAPDASVEELGRVGYFFDRRDRRLCRSFVPYRLTLHQRLRARCDPVLEGVDELRFSYLSGKGGGWVSRWREADRPAAVKITVASGGEAGRRDAHTVIVTLPVLGPKPTPAS